MVAKRRSSGPKRKRVPLDWVVNDYTYSNNEQPLGNNQIIGLPLTFPRFVQAMTTGPGAIDLGGYAYPEQERGQMAYRVSGSIECIPETWVLGSLYRMAVRIVTKPMDWQSGVSSVTDPNYNLYDAAYANEDFVYNRHITNLFSMGSALENININVGFKKHIKSDEALYIFIENQTGITAGLRLRFKLRTLMRADE